MARGRAKLTEKQERILIQAQLMGLTPRDMQQISNRLIALQKEAEDKAEIAENISGYSWQERIDETRKDEKGGWIVTTPDGYRVEAVRGKRGRSSWDSYHWDFNFTVSRPGTRMQVRKFSDKSIYIPYDWKKSLMPGQSKELYAIIKWTKDIKWKIQNQ